MSKVYVGRIQAMTDLIEAAFGMISDSVHQVAFQEERLKTRIRLQGGRAELQ